MLNSYSADKVAEDFLKQFVFYSPTPKQLAFHEAGLKASERLFLGGNRMGKTNAVCMEMAMHLTGVCMWSLITGLVMQPQPSMPLISLE